MIKAPVWVNDNVVTAFCKFSNNSSVSLVVNEFCFFDTFLFFFNSASFSGFVNNKAAYTVSNAI